MKRAMTQSSVKKTKGTRMHNTLVYMRQHWQLYLIFMLPAVVLTIVFRYIPMGGILIAFTEYLYVYLFPWEANGWDSPTLLDSLSSPDFMQYLLNTLKLSVFGLLWGFSRSNPAGILAEPDHEQRHQAEDSACSVHAEFYLCDCSLRYCPDPAFFPPAC